LKSQVLKRLAAERGGVPWKRWALAAAAAVLLVATPAAILWNAPPKPEFVVPSDRLAWTKAEAEQYLNNSGIRLPSLPNGLNYDLLRQIDLVPVEGRAVPRLKFLRADGFASVDVYVVDTRQFDLTKIKSNPSVVPLPIEGQETYFCFHLQGGNIDWLRPPVF
ncbi:MAG TPA: hypothetical protein VFE62_08900, partial [Gemmataceae bacterium]|nr:hypothetical protein [Gemmataceae bacterium]